MNKSDHLQENCTFQYLKTSVNNDGTINIIVTTIEFEELRYALEVLNKKRKSSRKFQRKKLEESTLLSRGNYLPKPYLVLQLPNILSPAV